MLGDRKVIQFSSGAKAPYHVLSNFHFAVIHLEAEDLKGIRGLNPKILDWLGSEGKCFSSTEHIWQSLKATNKKTFLLFCNHGRFTKWEPESFIPFLPAKVLRQGSGLQLEAASKKFDYWGKKVNVGVIPKMVANKKYAKQLGLQLTGLDYSRESLPGSLERSIWVMLFTLKFAQNAKLRKVLLATGDDYLLEFDRGATRPGKKVHWGGNVVGGKLYGENVMSKYLMEVRALLSE